MDLRLGLWLILGGFVSISTYAGEPTDFEKWDFYSSRYNLPNVADKLTDNRGDGFPALYGTRNFRQVLKGVVYRGGANNKFHKESPRPNMNPLPPDGLQNLCNEGFQTAVYLYSDNYETAAKTTPCRDIHGGKIKMSYLQKSPSNSDKAREILELVHQNLKQPTKGPIYLHCWNGWHASGMISAFTLRQFCGWSAEKAVAYWDENTDGMNTEPEYERIRQRIRDFQPFSDLKISAAVQNQVCPQ